MRHSDELERRLVDWGATYGGGQYGLPDGIKSPMGQMMHWGGRPPSGLGQTPPTPEADAVNDAVRALERQRDGRLPAQVLRFEYMTPGLANDSRLQRLARTGERISRAQYYQLLRIGRTHVAAWLRIPYSTTSDEQGACV